MELLFLLMIFPITFLAFLPSLKTQRKIFKFANFDHRQLDRLQRNFTFAFGRDKTFKLISKVRDNDYEVALQEVLNIEKGK